MKNKLLLTLLIGFSSLSFSQSLSNSDRNKLQNYYLINKFNDTTLVYSGSMSTEELHCGFKLYDKDGQLTDQRVNPEQFNYLLFVNSYGKTIKLKSFPTKKTIQECYNKNVFMFVLIENSDQDLKNGKVDFYSHEFTLMDPINFGEDVYGQGYKRVHSKIYYFKDLNGLHEINFKHQFKHYPKILGKKLYKKMMNSSKDQKQFLLDYFTEYNRNIVNFLKQPTPHEIYA